MKDIRLAVEMTFISSPDGTDEQFEMFVDAVQEQLECIGREVNLATRLADRVVDFATTIEATSFELAAAAFLVDLRTALHAVGCHTPDWPRFEATDQTVRALQEA